MINPKSPITAKQSRFIDEYLKDLNGTQAALRAGYAKSWAPKYASQMLAMPKISVEIAKRMEERSKRTSIDADWVLHSAKQVFDRCMQVEPIFDRAGKRLTIQMPDGTTATAFTFDSAGANRALELIGKHTNVGAFRERHIHTGMDDGPIKSQVASVTPEQLADAVRTVRDDY